MKKLMVFMMMAAMTVNVYALVDLGFEDTAPGIVGDVGELSGWAAWNNNSEIGSEVVRSGVQSAKLGIWDVANSAGDKYSNLRQYELRAEGLDNTQWTAGAWVYYDSTQEGNGAASDAIQMKVIARSNWNIDNVISGFVINASDLVDAAWNYLEIEMDVPVQGLDPLDPEYANKFRDKIGLQFEQNGWMGHTGTFYIDDVTFTQVPEPATMVLLSLGGLLLRRRRS